MVIRKYKRHLMITHMNKKIFKETRVEDQILWLERISSIRGFPRTHETRLQRGKSIILIPIGEKMVGWENLLKLMNSFDLSQKKEDRSWRDRENDCV